VWLDGDAGSVAAPAYDVVRDFGMGGADPNGADVLDLSDLLQGEQYGSLSHYLNLSFDGADTIIKVSSNGHLSGNGNGFDQQITLENVDLTGGMTDQNAIINSLIAQGKLVVDQ